MVVDTSALMAIVLVEPLARRCAAVLEAQDRILISAGTLAEALIVAARRNVADEMTRLLDGLELEVVDLDAEAARRVAFAYDRWGKGVHPAALNFADCFAYELAAWNDCPLLFIGDDFSRTDIRSAL